MFPKALLLALVAVCPVFAAPAPAAPQVTGQYHTDVLQFALTLEHLESAFYAQALAKYDAQAFADAGFPEWVRNRFEQIGQHEADHVKFLTSALGVNATQACEYSFPHNNPREFAALSVALENVGDSAYVGAAQLVTDKSILTAAASILSVEARHAAWVSAPVDKDQGWNGPFDAPLTPSGAFSLASLFVTSCPESNPALPVKLFPALTLSNGAPAHGSPVTLTFDGAKSTSGAGKAFAAWLSGLNVVYSDVAADGSTTVPDTLEGTAFVAVVSSKAEPPSDDNLLSGFAIAEFPFDSHATEPAQNV
ncbi:ferritin-like domain-containing protein [Trametes elegans]|nr:ferritin-like domain-containing protein [Trametes elegans]